MTQFTGGVTPGFSVNGIPARIAAGPDGNLWFTERARPGAGGADHAGGRRDRVHGRRDARLLGQRRAVHDRCRAGRQPVVHPGPRSGAGGADHAGRRRDPVHRRDARASPPTAPRRASQPGPDGNLVVHPAGQPGPGGADHPGRGRDASSRAASRPASPPTAPRSRSPPGPTATSGSPSSTTRGGSARITPAGVVTEFTGGVTPGFSANSRPGPIAAGPDGNLWFTEENNPGAVARITPGGVVTEFTGGLTPGFAANSRPLGITAGRTATCGSRSSTTLGGGAPRPGVRRRRRPRRPASRRPTGTSVLVQPRPEPGRRLDLHGDRRRRRPAAARPAAVGHGALHRQQPRQLPVGRRLHAAAGEHLAVRQLLQRHLHPGRCELPGRHSPSIGGDATFLTSTGRSFVVTGGVFGLPAGTPLNVEHVQDDGLERPARQIGRARTHRRPPAPRSGLRRRLSRRARS